MYKILVTDDEGIVIDAIKFIIDKNFGENCIVESAKSGRKAIEIAEFFRPDIVLMDIQMKGINGIAAMQEIRKSNPNSIFIVISAYDKFSYAKDAIAVGVMTYINKPIKQEELTDVLRKAMKCVDSQKEKRSRVLETKEKLEIVTPIIENGFMYSVIYGRTEKDEFENFRTLLAMTESSGYMMVIKGMENSGAEKNVVGISVRMQRDNMKLREAVKSRFRCVVGAPMGNMVAVYVPLELENPDEEYTERVEMIENARKLIRNLRDAVQLKFRIGIGSVRNISEASKSYEEAMSSLTYNSVDSVVHTKDQSTRCIYEEEYPVESEKRLFEAVANGNVNEALCHAGHFFDWMLQFHENEVMDIKLKVLEFVLRAETMGYEMGGKYYFSSRKEYLQTIIDVESMEKLREWFLERLEHTCRNIATMHEHTTVDIVREAQKFIEENFKRDISLDEVSQQVNISPYYFSKLFKKRTGENYVEYVTNIRMKKAKELLRNTNLSIKEICLETGYSDPNYFSRMFRKHEGISPTEYKGGSYGSTLAGSASAE